MDLKIWIKTSAVSTNKCAICSPNTQIYGDNIKSEYSENMVDETKMELWYFKKTRCDDDDNLKEE